MRVQIAIDDRLAGGQSTQTVQANAHKALAIMAFVQEEISLGELAKILCKRQWETIMWLKARNINPPAIQGYTENAFTPDEEKEVLQAAIEAKQGIGLSQTFDNAEDAIAYLNQEAKKYNKD